MVITAGAIAAIVVGHRHRVWLVKCLESLLAARPDRRSLDVYFVDNASADGSVELVRTRFPTVHTIANSQNSGFSGGCNQALRLALATTAEYVFLLNPDTVCPPKLLDRL